MFRLSSTAIKYTSLTHVYPEKIESTQRSNLFVSAVGVTTQFTCV